LESEPLPAGTRLELGGDLESSGEANQAIFKTAPVGLLLLLFFLLLQFNSYKRVAIILLTVPLAAAGIFPGLVLTGSPFGFQPLLGIIALVGIVVNNAIVLIDLIDQGLSAGKRINTAVTEAVARRTRPILLTTATTVAGLLPLALSSSTLWPPMAWAIISGLLASTIQTLLVVPAVCRLTLKEVAAMPTPAHDSVELR
jgi:multidrug efflux pump subunit AcrB